MSEPTPRAATADQPRSGASAGRPPTGGAPTAADPTQESTKPSTDPSDRLVLGIDIGGTKIAAGVVTFDGEVISTAKAPTAGRDTAEDLWQLVVEVGDRALAEAGVARVAGVGAGCAGPMTWPEGVVSPLNLGQWREFPLAARIREQWPFGPVHVHNDAVCVAIAEHWVGAAKGAANALGIVVSTGVGGGLILAGKVNNGGLGNSGHIGHMVAEPDGQPCFCGGRGCLEGVARGPAIVEWAQERGWSPPEGTAADGVSLLASARAGDETARAAFRRSGEAVGMTLASVGSLLDLDVVAVGGGLVNAEELLFEPLHEAFDRHAGFRFVRRLKIVPAAAGQESGIVGAAALVAAADKYWTPDTTP